MKNAAKKTEAILFGKSSRLGKKPIFKLGPDMVKTVGTMRYLGVTIDDLSWIPHVDRLRTKIRVI